MVQAAGRSLQAAVAGSHRFFGMKVDAWSCRPTALACGLKLNEALNPLRLRAPARRMDERRYVPFISLRREMWEKVCRLVQRARRFFTASLRALPSTVWPASLPVTAFITLPMSLGPAAAVS